MVSGETANILVSLFEETGRKPNGITKRAFLAKHHAEVAPVERLITAGVIQSRDGQFLRLPLLGLVDLARKYQKADSVLYLCDHLFKTLRKAFIQDPETKLAVREIAVMAEMPERQVARAFGYMLDAP